MKKITVMVKEPGKKVEVREVVPELETFQELVEGDIEGVYPDDWMGEHNIMAYLNDEGKLIGLTPNVILFGGLDILVGTCVFVKGNDEGEDISLEEDDQEYINKYCQLNSII